MIKNYLIVTLRNLMRQKTYSILNTLGLAIGMACCILILCLIQYEMSFDQFHQNSDRIFRIIRETRSGDGTIESRSGTSGPLAPALLREYPEVQTTARIWRSNSWTTYQSKGFFQDICMIDRSFLDIFTFPFVKGDPQTAFQNPFSIVITEQAAKQYFPYEDPIGKTISIKHRFFANDYLVTGVMKDIPQNSTIQFSILTATIVREPQRVWETWHETYYFRPIETYILLPDNANPEMLERKLLNFMEKYMGKDIREYNTYHLQPFKRIHLYSNIDYNMSGHGDINRIYLFSAIAITILLIACINFMNLATARATRRAKEVGLRKVVGAHRRQLIQQFLGESIAMAFLALLLGVTLAQLVMPVFSAYINSDLSLTAQSQLNLLPILLAFTILVGLVAGSYPAFYLSAFQPVSVLKGTPKSDNTGAFRQSLVVFQFCASIILIIGTSVIYQQIFHMTNKTLGYNKNNIIRIPIFDLSNKTEPNQSKWLSRRHNLIKRAFLGNPNILKASALRSIQGPMRVVFPEGTEGSEWRMQVREVDEDFFDTFEIELIAGRNFSTAIPSDTTNAFILNETAVKKLGWKNPIGKTFGFGSRTSTSPMYGTVVGVVKDYQPRSWHQEIQPAVFCNRRALFHSLYLKTKPESLPETLTFIEQTWKTFLPEHEFTHVFLSERLTRIYQNEKRLGTTTTTFSSLAIFVACLGLFGLTSFTVTQRTKEIGIRKILGASIPNLLFLLSEEFLKLIFVANLIAWPIAYYIMNSWLQSFAYRVDLGVSIFFSSGLGTLLIALLTVSFQALKATGINPADALRNE